MSLWDSGKIATINIGTSPNDGSGDNIRNAFNKVDTNFANINSFLRSSDTINFTQVNIDSYFGAQYANISNLYVANATGTTSNFTGNTRSGNIIANTGLYSSTVTYLNGNTYVSGNIIPTSVGGYNLGTSSNPFGNLYVQNTISTNQISQSTDAGILKIHANASVGDLQDTGIFGNITAGYGGANTYAFFGHQYTTDNFIYKITPTDTTTGNNIIVGGVYGNVQFGSALLSNTTVSTSTSTGALVVAGGAGISGNVNIGGNTTISGNAIVTANIYSGGYQVVTLGTTGIGPLYSGGTISGIASFIASAPSTSTGTGALIITNGGLGVAGNIYTGTGFYGNIYGNVLTASQPYITALGTLGNLTVQNTINANVFQATTIGTTNMTVTGTINLTGATINGAGFSSFAATGNISAGTTSGGFVGNVYGSVLTAAQPYITSLGILSSVSVGGSSNLATVVTTNFSTANAQITGGNVTGVTNLSGTNFSTTTGVITNFSTGNAVITGGNIIGLSSTNFSSGNAQITGGNVTGVTNLSGTNFSTTTGVVVNLSSGNAVISGGYISALTNAAITTASITTGLVTNFSTANAVITGGYIRGVANVSATQATITNFSTGNAVISGGYITGLSNVMATTGNIGTLFASIINATTIGNTGASLVGAANLSNLYVNNTTVGANVSIIANANIALSANTTSGSGIYITGNILPSANLTYNLGSTGSWFNTFYGVSSQAKYADLAERYTADAEYDPGTVVVFGGDAEVTVTSTYADARVAGAISTDPAYLMNAGEPGLPIALRGRIPVKVDGPVTKGDSLVTATKPGYATSVGTSTEFAQAVFAKSIETNLEPGEKIITAVIL